MRSADVIHEPFMNPSGMILPRVGVGVGVGGRWGLGVGVSIQDQIDLLAVGAPLFGFGASR